MIFTAILTIFRALISVIILLLPTIETLPLGAENAISFFTPYWSSWSQYIPVATFVSVLSFVIVVESSILTFHFFDWTYKKIRG